MKQEVICIVCPRGCHLTVDPEDGYKVTGNFCARGIPYGKAELINPTRVVTSTVVVNGKDIKRCPVKTDQVVPKKEIKNIMKEINQVNLKAPVKAGDIIIHNILNTEANLVATRDID